MGALTINGLNEAGAVSSVSIEDTNMPVGAVFSFAGETAPEHCLICDGSVIGRDVYAELFAAIGTTYGEGDGETTFNIPDLRGVFVRGWDNGRGIDSAREFGSHQEGTRICGEETGYGGSYDNPHTIEDISTVYGDTVSTGTQLLLYTGSTWTRYNWSPNFWRATRPVNVAMQFCIIYE